MGYVFHIICRVVPVGYVFHIICRVVPVGHVFHIIYRVVPVRVCISYNFQGCPCKGIYII